MTPVFIFTYLRAINYACISDTSQANASALIVYTSENCADGIGAMG